MRVVLLIALLLSGSLSAQAPITIPTTSEWVGPLEFQDSHKRVIVPTHVTITISGDTVTGDWIGLTDARPSGLITGTIGKNSQFMLTVRMFAGGEVELENGERVTVGVERCTGEGRLTGTLLPTGVLRWTANKVAFDSPVKRMQDRNCEDISRVTWTLQRYEPIAH